MKYVVRINKRVRYLKTYTIVKKVGPQPNLLTKLFIKIFNKKEEEGAPL
ncbi:MAG TPA: hypothetical protein VL944_00985 [Candidatus Acidoferrum sp.]|nr:hypothetical protein [Candidatus Acidoferrum sp.]